MHKRMSPHGDYDHMGEAINLVNNFKVEKVIFQLKLKKKIKHLDLKNKDFIVFFTFKKNVL